MWLLRFILKAAIFFTLFAFALNNQEDASVHFFFGTVWNAPLVLIVLSAFVLGVAVGVMGMVPRWWRHRRLALRFKPGSPDTTPAASKTTRTNSDTPHGI